MTLRRRKKLWSATCGSRPHTVLVFEREKGGILYLQAWSAREGKPVRRSLGHRDRELALEEAEREAKALRDGAEQPVSGPITVGVVLSLYLKHRTPQKGTRARDGGRAIQAEDRRRAQMWKRYLGADRRVDRLGLAEWQAFIRDRSSGAIDAHGTRVAKADDRKAIGARGVDADLVFLTAVFNWALVWKGDDGRSLLARNPYGAPAAGVRKPFERPRNRAPNQPVATFDRYLKVREAASRVWMLAKKGEAGAELREVGRSHFGIRKTEGPVRLWMRPSYLPELLELAEQTGRRITAICQLQYDDILREPGQGGAITHLRWRPIKGEDEQRVPVSAETRATLARVIAQRPGVGAHPLFPSPRNPRAAIAKRVATEWLERAETIAGVGHMAGGKWHPYRRKWATERKEFPTKDVMIAGGWKDDRSLKDSYQQADAETTLAVVNAPKKLIERTQGA